MLRISPFPFYFKFIFRVLCIFVRFPFVFYQFDFVFIVIILNASVNGLVYLFYSVIYSFFHFCFLPFVSGFINPPMVTRHRSCLQPIPFVLFYFCFPLSPLFSFCNFIDFILFIPILFPVCVQSFFCSNFLLCILVFIFVYLSIPFLMISLIFSLFYLYVYLDPFRYFAFVF